MFMNGGQIGKKNIDTTILIGTRVGAAQDVRLGKK